MARRLRVLAAVGSVCTLALAASDAKAWTPTTHVYLAQKAWEDAQDGKVRVDLVDYEGRTITGPKGEYDVSPEILNAIRANPHAFFSGVLGPDAYPDIVTGQMRIHPPGHAYAGADSNTNGPGTDPWLWKLWTTSHTGQDRSNQNIAFVTGYLSHAAGDMFAHTFMNTFTGGIFDLMGLNGLKHITLEGYVGMRTPGLSNVVYPVGGNFGGEPVAPNQSMSIFEAVDRFGMDNGVREFIARTLVDPPAGSSSAAEKNRQFSIPAIFSDLRTELRSSVAAYESQEAPYRARFDYTHRLALWSGINMPGVIARACNTSPTLKACPDPTYSATSCPAEYPTNDGWFCGGIAFGSPGWFATAMSVLAAAATTEWVTWKAWGFRELRYIQQKSQIHEIDIGLNSWIETSHNAAQAWFFNPDGLPDIGGFIDEYVWFATHRLISMVTGLPSWPIDTFGAAIDFIPNLVRPQIDKMKKDMSDFVCKAAFGADVNTLKERYTRPQNWLNQLYQSNRTTSPPAGGLPSMSLARVNAIMNVPITDASDIATGNPAVVKKTWTVDNNPSQKVFPPAYNTMVMIKLLMLKPSEVDRLVRDLGGTATLGALPGAPASVDNNPMLGFAETIDGSHQWLNGPKMVFARECAVYKKIFMNQRPFPILDGEPLDPNLTAVEPSDALTSSQCGLPVKIVPLPRGANGAERQIPNLNNTIPNNGLPFKNPGTTTVTIPPPAIQITANDAKALAAGELPPHPPGALYPGQSIVVTLNPSDVPHKWSIVSGPGKLSDPLDPNTGASPQAQATRVAEIDKRAAQAAITSKSCGKDDLRCLKQAHTSVATIKKERRTVTASMKLVSATPLIGATAIYEAPTATTVAAAGSPPPIVTIKVEATDGTGRSATIALALLPQPLSLNVKAPTTVRAGGSFSLVSDPPIPLKWVIVSGPQGGTIGDPSSPVRSQIVAKDITPFTTSIRQADAKLMALPPEPSAPPPSPTPNRFDKGAGGASLVRTPPAALSQVDRQKFATEKNAVVKDKEKDLAAAVKKVQEIDGLYKAPVKLAAAQPVVLKAIALDGTGRSTTITVQVTP